MEPRATTTVTPLAGAVSTPSGLRFLAIIGNFYYTDTLGTGTSSVSETVFTTAKKNVVAADFRLFIDGVEQTLRVGSTPAAGEYNLINTGTAGSVATVTLAADLATGAVLTARYRYNEDSAGASIFNKVVSILPSQLRAYESMFGTIQEYNDLMLAADIAKSYGVSRLLLVPTNVTIGVSGTPTSPDITDALTALRYQTVDLIVPLFNNDSVITALQAHLEYMSDPDRAEYRMGLGAGASTTQAAQVSALAAWGGTYRMHVACVDQGLVEVLLGSTYYDKQSCFLALASAAKYASFAYLAKPLTRETFPRFKLKSNYTLDQREELQDHGGLTFKIIGLDTVQCAWGKTATNTGLADFEEGSLILVKDFLRKDLENKLDAANAGKVIGVSAALGGVTGTDLSAMVNGLCAGYKSRGLIVEWRPGSVEFIQNISEPRRFDGTLDIKLPYPANWTALNIVSYV